MKADFLSPFFTPEREVNFYLPPYDEALPFISLGLWSELVAQWVPLMLCDGRNLAKLAILGGIAARLADAGVGYWAVLLVSDDEPSELAHWRSVPAYQSAEWRKFIEPSAA